MVRGPQRERLVLGRMSQGRDCMASPVLSSGMLTKHPCLGTRSGAISIPGSLQTRSPGARLSFRGMELSPGSYWHHAPQHHSVTARVPGCQRCISLFHNHYQGLLSGAGAAAGVPGWLRYRERTTIAQGLPPTGTKARPRSQPNLPLPLPTGRGWLKLGSLLLLSSSGHSVSGTSHWILGVQAQVLLATVS